MQLAALTHETPSREAPSPGLGVVRACQALPFHSAAIVTPKELSLPPVAMHLCGLTQDTLSSVPAGRPVVITCQLAPFHTSARLLPTDTQLAGPVHDTPSRPVSPPGCGVGKIRHLLPYHDATTGNV